MRKQIVMGVWVVLVIGGVRAAEPQDNGGDTAKATAASELARSTLARELQMDATSIEAIASVPQTWPDSSLGCGKPGAMAAQVITSGHAVTLKTSRGNYRVHVAEKYAVVCGPATQFRSIDRPGNRGVGLPLKNLNRQIELARADLASRIAASEKEIQTLTFLLAEWPDSSMDCIVAGEDIVKQTTKGYRIPLQYAGRVYFYHTDLQRVRACPAIQAD